MAKETDGALQFVLVDVGMVQTALLYEIDSNLDGTTSSKSAINKGSSSFLTKNLTNQEWNIGVSCHLDDVANPAADVIWDAWENKTQLDDVELDTSATGWKFTGDCNVDQASVAGPVDGFVVLTFNLQGTGPVARA